ncbi:MAG: hypothetical protein K1X89_03895 [Myxococcaceae bacterium]|nr:hypothetical protein [Myxococcaceae bacterium]
MVFFKDPRAVLFGRRGRDGGQDARSGDGLLVYQAKHHEDGSASKAIADAKEEVANIKRCREPGHSRFEQWRGVTHWRLVTNAEFNPTSDQKWKSEVVPLFAALGLEASYWERANLDALLDAYPEVSRAFFENTTRALLSLPEIRSRLVADEPFLQRDLSEFVGRQEDVARVGTFAKTDRLFLVMHGPGGVGKTRLLLEAGEELSAQGHWQVLWANTATMTGSASWFTGIIPERPTLLLVDEPEDEGLLQVLAEQLGTGRTSQWKVVVAVRSPKDPVLRFLSSARMQRRCEVHEVVALSREDAAQMSLNLLRAGPLRTGRPEELERLSTELAARFSTHPVWLTLAVHLLETRGDLNLVPTNSEQLASEYLEEIVRQQADFPPEQLTSVLRWVALLAPFNRDDQAAVRLVGEGTGLEREVVLSSITRLIERRALTERGANRRLVELKPDVMRDHVLLTWLAVASRGGGQLAPSIAALELAQPIASAVREGGLNAVGSKILVALARTEMLLRLSGRTVDLLSSFFEPLRAALASTNAVGRVAIAEVLHEVAYVRPLDVVDMSRRLRTSAVEAQEVPGFLGNLRRVGHDDVVLALGWSVYHAAAGADSAASIAAVLQELCLLTESEAEIGQRRNRGLPNDGKRAAEMVDRTIQGGPEFWGEFDEAAEALALQYLDAAVAVPLGLGAAAALRALLHSVLGVERERISSEGRTFTIQRWVIHPSDPAWARRERVHASARGAIEASGVPTRTKQLLWAAVVESHRSLTQARRQLSDDIGLAYRDAVLQELEWAESVLGANPVPLEELACARDLWDWHRRFDTDQVIRTVAERLEQFYSRNSLAAEFEPLTSWDSIDEKDARTTEKATSLACEPGPDRIVEFVRRAQRFLGTDIGRLQGVGWQLGALCPSSSAAREFVPIGLGSGDETQRYFASVMARSWVAQLRRAAPDESLAVTQRLVDACGSDEQRARLLEEFFAPPRGEVISPAEHQYLRQQLPLFLRAQSGPGFLHAVAWTFDLEWNSLRSALQEVVTTLRGDQLRRGLDALVESVFWGARRDEIEPPADLGAWLLDQAILISDLDEIGDGVEWRLGEIFKRVPYPDVPWLLGALKMRRTEEMRERSGEPFRAMSTHSMLSRYVRKLDSSASNHPQTLAAVRDLIALVHDQSSIGYYAPQLLAELDPEGWAVPSEVARAIGDATSVDDLLRLGRVAGAYAIGGPPWRVIARAALSSPLHATKLSTLCSALGGSRSRSWHGTPGEVPAVFVAAAELAKRQLDEERDPVLLPFWSWQKAVADAELRQQEEEAREERGE